MADTDLLGDSLYARKVRDLIQRRRDLIAGSGRPDDTYEQLEGQIATAVDLMLGDE